VGPPSGVRTIGLPAAGATTVVLVRHGESVCGVEGVVGGIIGCTGLTATGVGQVQALADRLGRTGELSGVAALYASVLPRAIATAELLAPALDRWRDGPPLEVVTDCTLCELHPGEADGLTWPEFVARYEQPDWSADPTQPFAPGAESWTGFVERAAGAVTRVADQHPGETVVVACHGGVVEASMLCFLPTTPGRGRLGLRTEHASLTLWERGSGDWLLRRYNDVTLPG
jgi:probable phosphoglycerate mutase